MNKRAREIIFWIMDKKDYNESCSILDLTKKFKVSERTIRYDLDDITSFLIEHKQPPLMVKEHGVITMSQDTAGVRDLLGKNDFYSFKLSREERMDMIKYLIINAKNCITLQQIADILFVSRSTIIHDVDEVRAQSADHELEIVSLRKGLCACGRESNKRILLLSLLRKPFILQYRRNEDRAHMFTEEDEVMLRKIIKEVELANTRFLTDGSFEDLRRYLMIMMERSHYQFFIEIDYVSQHSSMVKMASDILDKIADCYGVEHRLQEEYLLADILYNLHYLKRNDVDEKTMQIQVVSKQFIDAITSDLNIELRNDFQFYQNLTNHLQSTFKDIDMGETSDQELLTEIMRKNPDVVAAIRRNIAPLEHYVQRTIQEEEIAYITIHVCAAIERNKNQAQQFTILLICNSGVGTSQLLLTRLKKFFQFYVADVLPAHALANYDVTGIDLIISTVPIQENRCESIILHPFLSDEDCILLGEKLEHLKATMNHTNSSPSFQRLQTLIANSIQNSPLDKDEIYQHIIRDLQAHYFPIAPSEKATLKELLMHHIQIDVECKDWREAVSCSAQPLLQEGYISERYVTQMIRNIENMGPYIVLAPGFALPHEAPDMGGHKLGMNLIRLKHPVVFNSPEFDPVEFVCCLATIDKDAHLKAMFHLMNLLSKPDFRENIHQARTAEEIYQIIYEYESIL